MIMKMSNPEKRQLSITYNIMNVNIVVLVAVAVLVNFTHARRLHRAVELATAQELALGSHTDQSGGLAPVGNFKWSEPNTDNDQAVNERIPLMRRQLNSINKQPVKSIQSSDGDIIDCVAKDKQPAFDHPLLKDHKFESFPSAFPTALKSSRPPRHRIRRPIAVPQTWHHNGSCPLGTIPVRRTSEEDLMRWDELTATPSAYGTKTHKPARSPSSDPRINADDDPTARSPSSDPKINADEDPTVSISINGGGSNNHEHAIAYVEGEEVYGASAVLSVWDPWVEASNEFSLSQIWILGGSFDDDLNSIEAGWQVSPELYGDGRPRLFIYWTTDGYQATGCYNLLCSGFVQTSDTVAIGAAISPVSRLGNSQQYQIEIMIWKDPRQGNWWMAFEGSHIVGYWPSELFSHLSDYAANMVEWGGEVVNSRPYGRHTGTQMGSGHFAEGGFGTASFFHSLQVVDANNNLQPISNVQTLAENPNCYDIKSMQDPTWGASFYFGGPGRNQLCL